MDFHREDGEGGPAQSWIDRNLPKCPMCKSETLWEVSEEGEQQSQARWRFRCPHCEAILSTVPDASSQASAKPAYQVQIPLERNLRIESVVRKEDQDFAGEEFLLTELQDWASES